MPFVLVAAIFLLVAGGLADVSTLGPLPGAVVVVTRRARASWSRSTLGLGVGLAAAAALRLRQTPPGASREAPRHAPLGPARVTS